MRRCSGAAESAALGGGLREAVAFPVKEPRRGVLWRALPGRRYGRGQGRGEPWEIDPAEIKIMQRSDGGPWVLGEGASGSVSLPLQMTFRHQAYSCVAAIRSVYRALGARSRIAVPASVVVAKVHHERPRCIWKFLTYRLCKAVMQRFIPADPVSDVGQRQTAKAMQIPVLTISFGAQVYKAQWRVQTVAVKMLSNTTEKQMEGLQARGADSRGLERHQYSAIHGRLLRGQRRPRCL